MPPATKMNAGKTTNLHPLLRLGLLLGLLYLFFVSITLMGDSFKFFGRNVAEQLLRTTSSPLIGLFIGILATSIIQSSSSTTAMTVGLVAAGALDVTGAIPIIIGANIGTSVTNTLVSVGHISRPVEFRRAFAAATVHDFFNLISVLIIFPLQLSTHFLQKISVAMATSFAGVGGMKLLSPLKIIVTPAVKWVTHVSGESGTIMLIVAILVLFISLRYIVVNLRLLVIGKVGNFVNDKLFKNSGRAMLMGLVLTVVVQSSSVTTSLVVPLAGAGVLTLIQIFPYTLGANVGTTITAIMASLITGNPSALAVAFAHLIFNVLGIVLVWPIKRVPIYLAESLAELALKSKVIPIAYILIVFFLIPLALISWIG